MTDSVRSIFEHNIVLLGDIDQAVYYFRVQQYDRALAIVADSIDSMKYVIEAIISDREYFNVVAMDSMMEMMTGILEAKKHKDFILLADLLELQMINFLIGVQELIISKEEIIFDEDNYRKTINLLLEKGEGFPDILLETINTGELLQKGYRVEFTSCGLMTLAAENAGETFYFHSNSRIRQEAFLLARQWYREDKKRYIIYGIGMGYHIRELLNMTADAEILIYEADLNVIRLACAFSDINILISNDRVSIIYDPHLELLRDRIKELTPEETFVAHYPSFQNIRGMEGKEVLQQAFPWSKTIEDC